MPLYRFQIHSRLPPHAVLERVRALVREQPGFRQVLRESLGWRRDGAPPPFVGKVEGSDFRCYRNIYYRNSFLPRVTGHVDPSPGGTTIDVRMSLHPSVAVAMLFWLGATGLGAVVALRQPVEGTPVLVPIGMFVFGVVLTLSGFYPEAIKARRLLEQHLGQSR